VANAARIFFALWYLGGTLVHLYAGRFDNGIYRVFGETSLLPFARDLWATLIVPNIALFTLLLAAFELTTGVLILSKGKYVKLGLAMSILFNLYLVQQGLGSVQPDLMSDFLANRAVNLVFAALQVPLFWVRFDRPIFARRSPSRRVAA
jgi:hypothetical protein